MERLPNRRGFLRATIATLGVLTVGCNSSEEVSKKESTPSPSPVAMASPIVDLKSLTQEEETIHFRRSLGLEDYSQESIDAKNKSNLEWDTSRSIFQNNFPPHLRSYGVLGDFYSRELLGPRAASYLIHGGEVHQNPLEYAWDIQRKVVMLAAEVGRDYWMRPSPKGWTIQGLFAHEFQHGVYAPWYWDIYPADIFAKLEHGMYRMLAQHDKVQGTFSENNTNWQTNDRLPRGVGARIAREFIVEKTRVGEEDTLEEVERAANKLGQELKIPPDKLKVNKKNSLLFGRKVVDLIKAGKIKLDSEHASHYSQLFREGLAEVYPEMFRALLTEPSLIQYNSEITAGAQEILSTLRGDSASIDRIRMVTNTIPPAIHQLWLKERADYPNIPEHIVDPKTAPIEAIYRTILNTGTRGIPGDIRIVKNELSIFGDYVEAFQRVCWKYPPLSRIHPKEHWSTFDPNEHVWKIYEIEEATDPILLRNFLKLQTGATKDERIRDEYKERFVKYTRILQAFIRSDAFGS